MSADVSDVPKLQASQPPTPSQAQWEVTLQQLRTTNEELQRRKVDAEKDRELFRDLYNKASAHASDVAKENSELLERAALAEGQVREGLVMIREAYEVRVRRLEEEIERLTGLNSMLSARDIKMQGDDIRRRAAEEEGVRQDNQRMRAELAQLRMDYNRMERVLEQLGEQELEELKEEEEELKETLEEPNSDIPSIVQTTTTVVSETDAVS